jgi:hypothetical protein
LVKISACDSPASSSASAALNREGMACAAAPVAPMAASVRPRVRRVPDLT